MDYDWKTDEPAAKATIRRTRERSGCTIAQDGIALIVRCYLTKDRSPISTRPDISVISVEPDSPELQAWADEQADKFAAAKALIAHLFEPSPVAVAPGPQEAVPVADAGIPESCHRHGVKTRAGGMWVCLPCASGL